MLSYDLQVLPLSDLNDTVCRCVGDTFSSSFYVPSNVINFLMIWNKFDFDNASVYGMLIAVFVIYILLAIILHRQDEKYKQVICSIFFFIYGIVLVLFSLIFINKFVLLKITVS